jgi:hypothetical protein
MRIATCIAALTLIACGPGRTTFARYPGASPTFDRASADPKALAVADKVLEAAGGAARWASAKQLRWSQVVMNDGKQVIAGEQAWDRWEGRHHARAKRDDGDIVVMRPLYAEGGQAFVDAEGKGLRKIESGTVESLAAARERWEFDTTALFMPFLLEEPGTKIVYEAERNGEDGKPHDVLVVTFPKDPTRTSVYRVEVSRETNLIDRLEIQRPGKSELERLGYALKDYREGGGVKYPGTLQNLGLQSEVITFKDLTVASEADDVLFVPPI